MAANGHPPVILFGYDSSPFTNKVRLALRLKKVPFSYVPVPSMPPRPALLQNFGLTYRKIPVLAIGRDIYCDTSLIIEALEHFFPIKDGWGTVYPACEGIEEWVYKGMARGFASFWTDRPLFRATTGLIPPSVWRSSFGTDRAQLIGHALDADKLARKIPANLSTLDLNLSLLEPGFKTGVWAIPTKQPSLADLSLYYQLRWGLDISAGKGIYNLTGGGTPDTQKNVTDVVFNEERYPGLWRWFHALEKYLATLPDLETKVEGAGAGWKEALREASLGPDEACLVPAAVEQHPSLDAERELVKGRLVSIAPDDTGRDDPTAGTLVALGVEEVVIRPVARGDMDVRIHFPRLGFVVKTVDSLKL